MYFESLVKHKLRLGNRVNGKINPLRHRNTEAPTSPTPANNRTIPKTSALFILFIFRKFGIKRFCI